MAAMFGRRGTVVFAQLVASGVTFKPLAKPASLAQTKSVRRTIPNWAAVPACAGGQLSHQMMSSCGHTQNRRVGPRAGAPTYRRLNQKRVYLSTTSRRPTVLGSAEARRARPMGMSRVALPANDDLINRENNPARAGIFRPLPVSAALWRPMAASNTNDNLLNASRLNEL
jgi:hypothetical protein